MVGSEKVSKVRPILPEPLSAAVFRAVEIQPTALETERVELAIWMLAGLSGKFSNSQIAMMDGAALLLLMMSPTLVRRAARRMIARGVFLTRERALELLQSPSDAGGDAELTAHSPAALAAPYAVQSLIDNSDSVYLSTVESDAGSDYLAVVLGGSGQQRTIQDDKFRRFWDRLSGLEIECRGCNQKLDASWYSSDSQMPSGYDAYCRNCKQAARKKPSLTLRK